MKLYKDKNDCTGCSLCKQVCSNSAISMQADINGFIYPVIDNDKCIECGACERSCPQNTSIDFDIDFNLQMGHYYAGKYRDESIRLTSSSGGVFWSLANYVIGNEGVVFGVKYDEDFIPRFSYAKTLEGCEVFRTSKYTQVSIEDIYDPLETFLSNRTLVLFVGTPCQVAAIKSRFKKYAKNLILCDLLCNSVPSPLVWTDYMKFIQQRFGKVTFINQRYKKYQSWSKNTDVIICEQGEIPSRYSLIHRNLFGSHLICRPSCSFCKYRVHSRLGDITIGDFWGIEKFDLPDKFNDDKGVSFIRVNSDKGRLLIKILPFLELYEIPKEDCISKLEFKQYNVQLADDFWKDYHAKGFCYVAEKYTVFGRYIRVRHAIGKIVKRFTCKFNING